MNLTNEQIAKAKEAKSVEELLAYAKEIGYKLTEEEAKKYFDDWNQEGELADEELSNVAGGSTCINGRSYSDDDHGYLITTLGNWCDAGDRYSTGVPYTCDNCTYCVKSDDTIVVYCRKRTKYKDDLNSEIGNGFNPA